MPEKYYSESDVIAFTNSVGGTADLTSLESWAATDADDPVLEDTVIEDRSLRLQLVTMMAAKFPGDAESILTNSEILYEYITSVSSTPSSNAGEPVILVSGLNYTVDAINGLLQNIIYEHSGGGGTFTLPAVDKLTLYVSNITAGTITFSPGLWETSTVGTSTLAANSRYKLIYQAATSKWYVLNLE